MTRKAELVVVSLCVVIGVCAIMAMAVAWGPKHECAAQFPKIIGCALGSYEGLAAGLIATGGALIAGWLAWSAARDQIWLAQRQSAENALTGTKGKLAAAEFELTRLRTAKSTIDQLHWDMTITCPGRSSAAKLVAMSKAQKFLTSSRDLDTESMGGKLWESANRLRLLAQQIDNRLSTATADQHPGILLQSEDDAASAVEDFATFEKLIDIYIARQDAVIDSLKSELADAEARISRNKP
jgi:hypothetical protein